MVLEPLLRRLSGILRGSGCGESVSAYVDDIPIIVTTTDHLQRVDEAIKIYETVAEEEIKREKINRVVTRHLEGESRCLHIALWGAGRKARLSC